VYDTSKDNRRVQRIDEIVKQSLKRLDGRRPGSWWVLSFISLAIVWLEIGMAFMTSYNVPTVGIGCRSMSYLIYGGLSTLPWIIQFLPGFRHPDVKRKAVCHVICLLSTLWLVFITFAAVSQDICHPTVRAETDARHSFTVQWRFEKLQMQGRIKRIYGLRELCVLPRALQRREVVEGRRCCGRFHYLVASSRPYCCL